MGGKHRLQCINAARGGSGLLVEDLLRAFAHGLGCGGICEQGNQGRGQFVFGGDAEGVVGQQVVGDGAEVGVVGAHDDGNAELGGFQRIVASGRNDAAADEGYRGSEYTEASSPMVSRRTIWPGRSGLSSSRGGCPSNRSA